MNANDYEYHFPSHGANSQTMTLVNPSPRPHSLPDGEQSLRPEPAKRLKFSQSSTQDDGDDDASAANDNATDPDDDGNGDGSSFEMDLSSCQEFHKMDDKFSQMQIDPEKQTAVVEEEGDAMQKAAISHVEKGGNLFLTGKAGTGKSWTSKQIRATLSGKGKNIGVVAPTGVAAININGMTVHSWGGFGIGTHYSDFDKMMSKANRKKICQTDALLFDEISMCSGHFFDVLECMVAIIRHYGNIKDRVKEIKDKAPVITENMGGSRGGDRERADSIMSSYMLRMRWVDPAHGGLADILPWGGMQLIVVGDFFQLPPVPNKKRGPNGTLLENEELSEIEYNNIVGSMGTYAFQSQSWSRSNFFTIELTTIHRQSESDHSLLELLNAMREGERPLAQKHSSAIEALKAPIRALPEGIVPTELHSTNKEVEKINRRELSQLEGLPISFKASDSVRIEGYYREKLVKKYSLEKISHLPQIWSAADGFTYPQTYHDAKSELQTLNEKKETLTKARKIMDVELIIKGIDDQLAALAGPMEALEKEISDVEKSKELNPENVSTWLKDAGVIGDPRYYYDQITKFEQQLRRDYKTFMNHATERFFKNECRVDLELELKEKSQVMLLFNLDLDNKLANGSRGVIEGFVKAEEYKELIRKVMERRDKSRSANDNQGEDIGGKAKPVAEKHAQDGSAISSENSKEPVQDGKEKSGSTGMMHSSDGEENAQPANGEDLYTIITTLGVVIAKNLVDLLNGMQFINDELAKVEQALAANMKMLPLVKFLEGQLRVIVPQSFKKEFKGCGEAERWQIPLTLAWAISIHKSQGMTIDLLRVNLDGCFAPGQSYVACSRGRSAETMVVENFSEERIITSDLVKQFYESLKKKTVFNPPTWTYILEESTKVAEMKKRMASQYGGEKCIKPGCQSECIVYQVKKDGHYKGKWVVQCESNLNNLRKKGQKEHGHTWRTVPAPMIV